ncbi:MAG: TlpA disulfide reductase family protein [Ginsengibacter sp.]
MKACRILAVVLNLFSISNNNSSGIFHKASKMIWFTIYLCIFTACSSIDQSKHYGDPVEKPSVILSNVGTLLIYLGKVDLSHNFIGLDTSENIINKSVFLTFLSSGGYIPLQLISKDTLRHYRLYKCPAFNEKDPGDQLLKLFLKNYGEAEYNKYKMKDAPFPAFDFVDLNGNVYNTKNTKGKIIVLKCWFIGCKPCVAEMPALNEIVKKYADRKDIVFISLSFDSEEELKKFLLKTPFSYAVIGGQQYYLSEILKINSYPTHILVNKQGNVVSISNVYDDMFPALKIEASK